ncbi:response regulator transcription factor [Ktedonosporobacter rubrisoli]|nr:response regulator transcription factor [Ktedonosporobacter rubrisoli]
MKRMPEQIPVIVVDDTPVKLRGIAEFVGETSTLQLYAQLTKPAEAMKLIETICQEQAQSPTLAGWLVLLDLHLGSTNGLELGRGLLELAPDLRIVIYTQDASWTLAAEIFRHEYPQRRNAQKRDKRASAAGLHGYALFANLEPRYLDQIATAVVVRRGNFIDPDVLRYLLKRLQGRRLTPRQEECAALIAQGLSNDEIALRMGFLHGRGKANVGPVENLVSELYLFFAIAGAPADPGRRVLLSQAYEAYIGWRQDPAEL